MDIGDWLSDQTTTGPMYQRLSDALAGAIARGDLRPGVRLPSERDLAGRLGVSRTTIVNAYHELQARGLVRGHIGRGTLVCAEPEGNGTPFAWRGKVALAAQRTVDPSMRGLLRVQADPDLISFAAGSAALECFPLDEFREITDRVLRENPTGALGLSPTEGLPHARRVLAARFGVRPKQILVIAGAQQGLDLIARCLLDLGDRVIMDQPGYLGAIQTFRAAGAQIAGWDMGRADMGELEDLILRYRPKLLYTNPTFQNPTGHTMPVATRRELLSLAARYRLPVVEDEPYREVGFTGQPPPSLFDLDSHAIVIHLSTFSKTLAPGLRLGWLAAAPSVIDQLALIKQRSDVFSAGLPQLVVAELLRCGRYDEHVRVLRHEHHRRHEAMLAALSRYVSPGTLTYRPVTGGLYLWCGLLPSIDSSRLLLAATTAGVAFVNGDLFYADQSGRYELRICFSGTPVERIEEGVRRLARALGSDAALRAAGEGTHPLP
jgi:2-aminoadipate transaminase